MRPYLYTLVLAATLAGCSADSDSAGGQPAPFDPSTTTPMGISTTLLSGVDQSTTRTPATVTTGSIGIFLENAPSSTSYVTQPNICYTVKNGIWNAENTTQTLMLGSEDANVCAYYPYNGTFANKLAIQMTSIDYSSNRLFYFAKNRLMNGTLAKRSTTFAMEHAYAQLEFILVRDANYPIACEVSAMTVSNPALVKEGTLDITTGNPAVTSLGSCAVGTGLPFTLAAAAASKTVSLLIVPQKSPMTTPLKLAMTVNKLPMTTNIDLLDLSQFQSGKKYTVTVSIQGGVLNVSSVTLEEWAPTPVVAGSDDGFDFNFD